MQSCLQLDGPSDECLKQDEAQKVARQVLAKKNEGLNHKRFLDILWEYS